MRIKPLVDFANEGHEKIGKYTRNFTLAPQQLQKADYIVECLTWHSIRYGESELDRVPDNKRGIYAFGICQESKILPPHGYILYIGIAGRDSNRPLRERYRDYLYPSKMAKRPGVKAMIGTWHEILRFFFAPVEDGFSSDDLKKLERQLNTALLPPYSKVDLDADVRELQKAF